WSSSTSCCRPPPPPTRRALPPLPRTCACAPSFPPLGHPVHVPGQTLYPNPPQGRKPGRQAEDDVHRDREERDQDGAAQELVVVDVVCEAQHDEASEAAPSDDGSEGGRRHHLDRDR